METLLGKLTSRAARVVVVGAGRIGLPLAVELARAGFRTTALDRDLRKVSKLNDGISYNLDVPSEKVKSLVVNGRLDASSDASTLKEADAVLVCVPTPLDDRNEPDLNFVTAAAQDIARYQHSDMLIVLESTSYPGTTNDVFIPHFVARGHVVGEDVYVAFSPERIDPGNAAFDMRRVPKVVGGATENCLLVASTLYEQVVDTVVRVKSTQTAEMVKMLENTFRMVNIALANELALMSRKLGIDPFEVVRAAATKPFGFMPFYPGPGTGGHCIPVDPLFLSWKLRSLRFDPRLIEVADAINRTMPSYVVERICSALKGRRRTVLGASVLIYGLSYKKDVDDYRGSPGLKIAQGMVGHGAKVSFMDPYLPVIEGNDYVMHSVPLESDFSNFDVVVVVADHTSLDRHRLLKQAKLIVDTRDVMHGFAGADAKVHVV